MRSGDLARAVAAEAVGAFALVFAGCGAIVVDAQTGRLGHLGVSLVFGLVITVMIYATGHVSGAHLNPAVTVAFAVTRHFPWPRVAAYCAAQVGGAVTAAVLVRAALGDEGALGATVPAGSHAQSFGLEVVLTFFLLFVVVAVATDTRAVGEAAALAIGATVALDALVGGPVSGASMNPARSLGPALAGGGTEGLWIYLTAPFAGGLLGAAGYQLIRGSREQVA